MVAMFGAVEQVLHVVAGLGQVVHLGLELGVDRLQLLVERLHFLLGGLQLLVGALQLLVGGLQLFVGGLEFLVRGLQLLDRGLQRLLDVLQLALQFRSLGSAAPWRRGRAVCEPAARFSRGRLGLKRHQQQAADGFRFAQLRHRQPDGNGIRRWS